MSYLNRVFASRFLKTLLLVCVVGLLIAAVWFLGPFLGFGDSRPWRPVEARVIYILLILLCLVCLWLRWPLFIIIVASLCVMVWVLGPFLLIDESHPLAAANVRLAIIGALLVAATLYGLWLFLLALKSNPLLLDKLVRDRAPAVENDASEVSAAIASAVNYVNKHRSGLSFFQRVILARKPLDTLPWYMVIGTQGAGKTSAILASGQHFPMPEQLNQVGKSALPTRNCECWFANDAVYIDTAGKYVSEPEAHLSEWRALLKALKKHRPVKALNGVVATFSAADILERSPAECFELAASLRARIDDLCQTLGVRFPVYILVTRLDQIPGFTEYFRMLTEQEREQVWGVTFPYGDSGSLTANELNRQIKEEFALLEERIERDMIVRQQEEYANRDRKKMYALPQDFHLLSASLAEVVHNIVFASRYDASQNRTLLRGIYFSSSHQPVGATLLNNQSIIRRWSNYVENQTPTAIASLTAQPAEQDFLINEVAYGRQYFLRQLFSEVIVKDRGLARHNLANASKYRLQRLLGHSVTILLTALLLSGFWHSYHHNRDYLDAVAVKVDVLEGDVNKFITTSQENLLPRLLMLTQYLPEHGALDLFNPPLSWRYGLYTGGYVIKASDSLYQFFLERLLLPQLQRQATLALQQAIDSGDANQIYRQLRLYLQLFGAGKFDKPQMIASLTELWATADKLQPYQEKSIFIAHLTRLFDSPSWRQYGQDADSELVKYARVMIERDDLASRLYERIKKSIERDLPADLTPAAMAKSRGGELFVARDEPGVTAIPGLYTRAGYYDVFKKKMELSLIGWQREDAWVMGKPEGAIADPIKMSSSGLPVNTVQQQILTLYLDEYAQHWQDFLGNLRIKDDVLQQEQGSGLAADAAILRMLSASDSPLTNLVTRAVQETTLADKEQKTLPDNTINQGRLLNAVTRINLAYAAVEKKLLQERVDNLFAPLREFVTGSRDQASSTNGGTALSKLSGALSEQYTLFVLYEDALKSGGTITLSDAAQQLGAEAQTWPDPLPGLIAPLLQGAWYRAKETVIDKSNLAIEENLGQICRATLQDRYPFSDSQREVKLADFERFFSTDGLADEYFKTHLADKVDTSAHPWRYKGGAGGSVEALNLFEKAAQIRQAFFQDEGGRRFSLTFDLSVPYLDPTITRLSMNFDGKQVDYAHGPVSPVSVSWPASRMTSRITLNATPRVTAGTSSLMFTGPWALFRWIENASDLRKNDAGEMQLLFSLDSRRANIDVSGLTYKERPLVALLKNFRCPGSE